MLYRLSKLLSRIKKKLSKYNTVYEADAKFHLVEKEDGSYYYISDDGEVIEPSS